MRGIRNPRDPTRTQDQEFETNMDTIRPNTSLAYGGNTGLLRRQLYTYWYHPEAHGPEPTATCWFGPFHPACEGPNHSDRQLRVLSEPLGVRQVDSEGFVDGGFVANTPIMKAPSLRVLDVTKNGMEPRVLVEKGHFGCACACACGCVCVCVCARM